MHANSTRGCRHLTFSDRKDAFPDDTDELETDDNEKKRWLKVIMLKVAQGNYAHGNHGLKKRPNDKQGAPRACYFAVQSFRLLGVSV